jgi:hypothetical protein
MTAKRQPASNPKRKTNIGMMLNICRKISKNIQLWKLGVKYGYAETHLILQRKAYFCGLIFCADGKKHKAIENNYYFCIEI